MTEGLCTIQLIGVSTVSINQNLEVVRVDRQTERDTCKFLQYFFSNAPRVIERTYRLHRYDIRIK